MSEVPPHQSLREGPYPLRVFHIPSQVDLDKIIWREGIYDQYGAVEDVLKNTFWDMEKGGYKIQLRPSDKVQILGQLASGEWACIQAFSEQVKNTDADFCVGNYVRIPDGILCMWLSIIDTTESTREKEWSEVQGLVNYASAEFGGILDNDTTETPAENEAPNEDQNLKNDVKKF